jgi:hypothetical protein
MQVLTAVLTKIQLFWDILPFGMIKGYGCFGDPQCFSPHEGQIFEEK